MPNIASAKKRERQTIKRHTRNVTRKSDVKTAAKKVTAAVDEKDLEKARTLLKEAQVKLARAKSKRVIHPNTAARKMSRLAKQVAKLEKSEE